MSAAAEQLQETETNQGIHFTHSFLNGADYLITLNRIVRGGTL